jgi:hypothetical protein
VSADLNTKIPHKNVKLTDNLWHSGGDAKRAVIDADVSCKRKRDLVEDEVAEMHVLGWAFEYYVNVLDG